MSLSTAEIERYYDTQQIYYTYLWSRSALHYGLWYSDTRTLREAIRNTDLLICKTLDITSADVVLDAGCGVGGTTFHIATTTHASVEAITLSGVQLRIARRRYSRLGVGDRVRFSRQDFCRTTFADSTFSKVFGIESISHAVVKEDFLREAYRLMKPGGCLAICDAFLTSHAAGGGMMYTRFLDGWALPNLTTVDSFAQMLEAVGFGGVMFHDLTSLIGPSAARIYRHGVLTWPFSVVKSLFGQPRRDFAARYQRALFEKRILAYGLFVARKSQ